MARPRKHRNDSAAGKRELLLAAKNPAQPVHEINPVAALYFERYAKTRASFDWSHGDLVRLTKVCERMAEVDLISQRIEAEGVVLESGKANPLLKERDALERTIMAAERSLSLYAPIHGAGKKSVFDQAKEAEKIVANNDGLLA